MVKYRVVPDPDEIIQADPFGRRTVPVPVKKTVISGFNHRPSDKEGKEQKCRRQKDQAGPRLARADKILQSPLWGWLCSLRWPDLARLREAGQILRHPGSGGRRCGAVPAGRG